MVGDSESGAGRKARFRALSLEKRYPRILERTLLDDSDAESRSAIDRLGAFLDGTARFAPQGQIEDPHWAALYERCAGLMASEIGFLDLEYLAFHEILRAHRYPERQVDPFARDKVMDIEKALASCAGLFERVSDGGEALRVSLLGNAHDASQLRINPGEMLLDPDGLVMSETAQRVDIVCDNAGQEFLADLVLAAFLLQRGADRVRLHVKAMPWFVSDVTLADAQIVFATLADGSQAGTELGAVLLAGLADGRLELRADPLWTRPLGYGQGHLQAALEEDSDLVILKGDLNYRRALDDISTEVFTPWAALPYRPDRDVLSLRSIKSHCLVGMPESLWPAQVDPVDFPTDGAIFLPQHIPGQRSV